MDVTEQERQLFKKLGENSAKKRFAGKTDAEISEIMSKLKLGKKKKLTP